MPRLRLAAAFAVLVTAALPVAAKTWEVKMLDAGAGQLAAYSPAFIKIKLGDTVKFIATGQGHNAAAMPSMIPAGAEAFKGKINEEIAVTPTVAGLYGYKCTPHVTMGMVGLIEVADASNKAAVTTAAEKLPPLAKKTMASLLAQAK